MPAIKVEKFGGGLPAWDDHLLPDGQAALAVNTYLFSGALNGWRQPKLLHALNSSTSRYAYRVPNKDSNDTRIIAPDSLWMEFDDRDTNVLRTPVVDDSFDRYYFASPSVQPKYNTYDRIVAGQDAWLLGVPAPGCQPGVTVEGGGDTFQLGNIVSTTDLTAMLLANSMKFVQIISSTTGLISDITLNPLTTNASAVFQGALYSDDGGQPTNLLIEGDLVTGSTSGTPLVLTFTNPLFTLEPNAVYWIGVITDTDTVIQLSDSVLTRGVTVDATTFTNGPPSVIAQPPNPNVHKGDPDFQIFANFSGSSSAQLEARAYSYTWVTAYGEEGPPSPPTVVQGWSNATWTLTLFQPPTADQGQRRNITTTRIYRTISNSTGNTTYFLVVELPVAQPTYIDSLPDPFLAINSQMVSLFWFPPPEDLQGIVSFPNGVFVGFRKNEIWFSEPYHPHAWPPNYVVTTEFPVVGLGVCGQAIVACTEGVPYLVAGVQPASMSLLRVIMPEPCISRGSIVSGATSVLYASLNGLIQVDQSGNAANITESWITRERWQELAVKKNIYAIKLASSYFAFGVVEGSDNSVAQQGYTLELSRQDAESFTIWPQPGGHRLGFSQLTAPNGFDILNVCTDPWTGTGLLIQNQGVYYYDFTDVSPTIVPYKWRSKIWQQRAKKNFEAIKVFFHVPPGTPTQNATRNTNSPQPTLQSDQYGILRVYADDTLVTTREIRTSGELLRVLSGFKAEMWQLEIEGRVNISNVQFATSVKELGAV